MNWIFLALLAPLLYSTTVFIDRFLVSRYFKAGQGALVIYTGLIGLPVFLIMYFIKPSVLFLNPATALIIMLNSFLVIIYLFPYYAAIRQTDPSAVVPLFQMIPVLNFILAFLILHELPTLFQIGAASLIILGSLGISLNFRNFKFNGKVFLLMLLATLCISINITVFKLFAINSDFITVSFWQYLGFFVFALILLFASKTFRIELIDSFVKNKIRIIGLNVINETINIGATVTSTFAALQAPLALVSAVSGLGPVFTFLIGAFLTIFFPKIIKEDLSFRTILQKVLFIIVIFIGGYMLNSTF